MEPMIPRVEAPWWVQFVTFGWLGSTRGGMLFSVALTLGAVVLAFFLWISYGGVWWLLTGVVGIGLALAAVLAIRWIDRHGTWERKP